MFKFFVSLIICFGAGALGSIFTAGSIPDWYDKLNKPFFSPPNWVFGPVWSVLYFLMAISLFLVWNKKTTKSSVKLALLFFAIQIILNAVWSPVFFGLRSPMGGLVIIALLWIAIVLTIVSFFNISKLAGILLVPYVFWVSFATVLNYWIVVLNR